MTSHSRMIVRQLATPLGPMVAVAGERGLCLLEFARGTRPAVRIRHPHERDGVPLVRGTNAHLDLLARELRAYFAGRLRKFHVRLAPEGTPFQLAVWRRVRAIRYGRVSTYGRVARELRRPGAQRAVGRANGDNPLSIVIPCHRLVGADGALRGYGGGLWRKRRLLKLEGAIATTSRERGARARRSRSA